MATLMSKYLLLGLLIVLQDPLIEPSRELQTLSDCTFVETTWHDGDSFLVRDEKGRQFTIRLNAVDCLEYDVHDKSDAQRLRQQRSSFGISKFGDSPKSSVAAAKRFGKDAAEAIRKELIQPFTVHTAFADVGGDGKHKRYYAFVTTSKGEDLAEKLVKLGLARALGVRRKTPDGRTRDELRDRLSSSFAVMRRVR